MQIYSTCGVGRPRAGAACDRKRALLGVGGPADGVRIFSLSCSVFQVLFRQVNGPRDLQLEEVQYDLLPRPDRLLSIHPEPHTGADQ